MLSNLYTSVLMTAALSPVFQVSAVTEFPVTEKRDSDFIEFIKGTSFGLKQCTLKTMEDSTYHLPSDHPLSMKIDRAINILNVNAGEDGKALINALEQKDVRYCLNVSDNKSQWGYYLSNRKAFVFPEHTIGVNDNLFLGVFIHEAIHAHQNLDAYTADPKTFGDVAMQVVYKELNAFVGSVLMMHEISEKGDGTLWKELLEEDDYTSWFVKEFDRTYKAQVDSGNTKEEAKDIAAKKLVSSFFEEGFIKIYVPQILHSFNYYKSVNEDIELSPETTIPLAAFEETLQLPSGASYKPKKFEVNAKTLIYDNLEFFSFYSYVIGDGLRESYKKKRAGTERKNRNKSYGP